MTINERKIIAVVRAAPFGSPRRGGTWRSTVPIQLKTDSLSLASFLFGQKEKVFCSLHWSLLFHHWRRLGVGYGLLVTPQGRGPVNVDAESMSARVLSINLSKQRLDLPLQVEIRKPNNGLHRRPTGLPTSKSQSPITRFIVPKKVFFSISYFNLMI